MCVEGKVCDGCMYVDVGKMRLLSLSIITNSAVITQPRDPGPISHHTRQLGRNVGTITDTGIIVGVGRVTPPPPYLLPTLP